MKLNIAAVPNLAGMMAAEITAGEKAVTKAVGDAGVSLKTAWRAHITGQASANGLHAQSARSSIPRANPA